MSMDYKKKEVHLGLNSFNEPYMSSGKEAWITLIQHLLFMIKGTYPSDPDMGIGVQEWDFEFADDVIENRTSEIEDQIRTYLPDIPLGSVELSTTTMTNGQEALIIKLALIDSNHNVDTAVIACQKDESIVAFESVL